MLPLCKRSEDLRCDSLFTGAGSEFMLCVLLVLCDLLEAVGTSGEKVPTLLELPELLSSLSENSEGSRGKTFASRSNEISIVARNL